MVPDRMTATVQSTPRMRVRYSYLPRQFEHVEEIFEAIRAHLRTCQLTLGPEVEQFERAFAALIGATWAIGVGSGTDALTLSLRALGIGYGDEVITAANTFIATVGAINAVGARPVLVDVTPYVTIDPTQIERAITPRTKAMIPVHLTGEVADMDPILALAAHHGLPVIEDACQAISATYRGRPAGTLGLLGAFSLHPLKNLNVWGDGGVIVTNDPQLNERLRLLRNHGLKNRDEVELLGYNSRLDSIQAIVGNWLITQVHQITERRIANAAVYDQAFQDCAEHLRIPPRRPEVRRVFHLYQVYARRRDELLQFLQAQGIEAKVHYPIPLPQQRALAHLGYRVGDFPETERQAASLITLPVDQHLSGEQQQYVIDMVHQFYRGA
jgi:dTDP-4-amino-4,6-dideoxygalactose transaminase